jgi:serine/threonine protein kinase
MQIYWDPEAIRDRRISSDKIRLGPLIGVGSYGRVYRAHYEGKDVAVKIIEGSSSIEADISQSLSHENLVKVIKTSVTGSTTSSETYGAEERCIVRTTIIMEYCDVGTLRDVLFDNTNTMSPHTMISIALDVAKGMDYLHRLQIIHGDLKCENVLLVRSMNRQCGMVAKVSDFSLSKQLDANQMYVKTRSLGTLTHMAPEVLLQGNVGYAADVYSYGIILWELVFRQRPWQHRRPLEIVHCVTAGQRPSLSGCMFSSAFMALVDACWTQEAARRPSFAGIMSELLAVQKSLSPDQSYVMVHDL